jgi:hypothetical protein
MSDFEKILGFKPEIYTSPPQKGDYPEIDMTTVLDVNRIKRNQTNIGCFQLAVSLERLGVQRQKQ